MYAIKGGWVGQTFALAKSNESEGRKSRIRRSKEERKAMVESFIKKYQSSNNGNFPSLNLTHKEVGGSFYTVREIVREIIQENRVLGPAKFTPGELNNDKFDAQFPLGSISKEPQTPLNIAPNESHFVPDNHQVTSEELVSISDGICGKDANQRFDNEGIINGSLVDIRIEESAKKTCEELQISKPLQAEDRVEKFPPCTAVVTPMTAEVVVETFPIRPVPKTANCTVAKSRVKNFTETLEDTEIEKVDLEPGNGSASLDQINSSKTSPLLDEEKEESLAGLALDVNSDLADKEAEVEVVQNSADPQLKSSNCTTTVGDTVRDSLASKDVVVEVSHNDVLTSTTYNKMQRIEETKEINASNGKIPGGTCGSGSMEESTMPKAVVIEDEADVQRKGGFQKGSNPTLDRIHLESWEGKSRNSTENNPLLAIFKSFVTAFIKFWSE